MLKRFSVRNYKNFKDMVSIDFEDTAGYQFSTDCITDGLIGKMLIYGRNATGKTNLGRALMDISRPLFPYANSSDESLSNADSQESKTDFSYLFQLKQDEVQYLYSKSSHSKLMNEELIVNKVSVFKWDYVKKEYFPGPLDVIGVETANLDRYLLSLEDDGEGEGVIEPKLSFLRWLFGNVAFPNASILGYLSSFIRRMTMVTVSRHLMMTGRDNFEERLEDPAILKDFEDFLNGMGIPCNLVLKKLPDGSSQLYFLHEKLVPFYRAASSGTMALVNLYRSVIMKATEASVLYLDEFDAFYHYEMSANVVQFLKKKYPNCQIIMTTHNTNLMTNRLMRPDCLFILSSAGKLTPLCKATPRELREGHNLEKMYISGEFEKYE